MEWVTTARPHVDRCATAWLVKRFIDHEATFTFIEPGDPVPSGTAPFDLPGVKHGHRGNDCSFETAMKEHGLAKDAALARIAALVHDIDFHAMKRAESAGIDAFLRGLVLAEPDDGIVLQRAGILFDALYAYESARTRTESARVPTRPKRGDERPRAVRTEAKRESESAGTGGD
ncbi:MAG: chromate resistance protein ChrB domain-containing protein [Thermoplasmatota archaeon]